MIVLGVVIYRPLLTFRPFDYWRIIYWHLVLGSIVMLSVGLAAWVEDGMPPLPDLGELALLALMLLGLVLFVTAVNRHGLKKMSELYARREQKLEEQRKQRKNTGEVV